jgi:hypothetical protein
MNQNPSRRYRSADPDRAIVVYSGNAPRPGILDSFCEHHAGRGVDVWKLDAQCSPEGCAEDMAAWGAHVAQTTRLPVFVVGSTRSAADIYRALQVSDVFFGAILIGDAGPPVLSEQLQSLQQNTKPLLHPRGNGHPLLARSGQSCRRRGRTSRIAHAPWRPQWADAVASRGL